MCFQVLSLPDDPAYRLVGRHRWVRFLPYLCVFLFWFAVVVSFRVLDRSVGWGLVTAVMTTAAWLAAVVGFRRACEAVPGWALCLAEFHAACAILLAAAYTGLKALQAWDDRGWQALLAVRPVLALLGAILALGLSVDAIRRGDAMRLTPVPNAEFGMRNAESGSGGAS
jgi:hypothetical protein